MQMNDSDFVIYFTTKRNNNNNLFLFSFTNKYTLNYNYFI